MADYAMAGNALAGQRLGRWVAGTAGLNLTITPFEQRADKDEWTGDQVWRIMDVFTTDEGSWELSDKFGSVDAWARTDYHQGRDFDGSGGSHHFFIKRLDAAGNVMPGAGLLWSLAGEPWIMRPAKNDGSENLPLENCQYDPSAGAHGVWRGTVVAPADVLNGVGLPLLRGYTQHTSTYVVFKAFPRTVVMPPTPEVEPIDDYVFAQRLLAEGGLARLFTVPSNGVALAIKYVDELKKQWDARP